MTDHLYNLEASSKTQRPTRPPFEIPPYFFMIQKSVLCSLLLKTNLSLGLAQISAELENVNEARVAYIIGYAANGHEGSDHHAGSNNTILYTFFDGDESSSIKAT